MTPADIMRVKKLLPTSLGSEEVRREIAADILRGSVFSARMTCAPYLAKVREVCTRILEGASNDADAKLVLGRMLEQMGHSPLDEGGIKNPASERRLKLIIDTQRQMAASVAMLREQTPATLALWPAWRLTRLESRKMPRPDWPARWRAAGESVGWQGAIPGPMVALKSSPIWQALGNGVGGFKDTLGNDYPPFAYSSGMDWEEVDRDTCEKLGLAVPAQTPQPSPTLAPSKLTIAEAVKRYGFPDIGEGLA